MFFKVVIWTTVVLCVLAFVFHVNVTSLVAGAGIAGIAIAFAAQETLQNISVPSVCLQRNHSW